MSPNSKLDDLLRSKWRELGFFYIIDEEAHAWRLIGSKFGLNHFVAILRDYTEDESNFALSEHIHLGPYMYLEIGTWNQPVITGHWIAGSMADLKRLASIIETKLNENKTNIQYEIGRDYADNAEYQLIIDVKDSDFDPVSLDPDLK